MHCILILGNQEQLKINFKQGSNVNNMGGQFISQTHLNLFFYSTNQRKH
jgi:hypothetical protein